MGTWLWIKTMARGFHTTTMNGRAHLPIDGILNDTFGGKSRAPGAG
jgi:hypothetical protein